METALVNLVETCPTCGTELARAKYLEVQKRLREQDLEQSKRIAAEVQRLVADDRKRFAAEQEKKWEKAQAAEATMKRKLEEQHEALKETKEDLEKLKRDKAALEKQRKEVVEKAVAKATEKKEAEMAKKAETDLARAREALQAEHDKEMFKKMGEVNRDKEAALKKVKELERRIEAKPANTLGDGGEIDVYEELKAAFESKGDKIRRVPKGTPGPDIVHDVHFKGTSCGKIVLDTKNRQVWQNSYTSKLRDDMLQANADYAILPTLVFPKDKRELCVQDNVLVTSPGRVVELVRILRNALIRFQQASRSSEERATKTVKLYAFINSEEFRQKFDLATGLTLDLIKIDGDEQDAHRKVWTKRDQVVKKMKAALGDIDDDITAIINGN